MAKETARKIWNKPELRQLGEIKDVAGPNPTGPEGGGTKS
jgi:hypothetical protein